MKGKGDGVEKVNGELVAKNPGKVKQIMGVGKETVTYIIDKTFENLDGLADKVLYINKDLTTEQVNLIKDEILINSDLIKMEYAKDNPDYQKIDRLEKKNRELSNEIATRVDKIGEHGITVLKTVGGIILAGATVVIGGRAYNKK